MTGQWDYVARQADDPVKRDLELIHAPCGQHLCDIEPGDTLASWIGVAADHTCPAES